MKTAYLFYIIVRSMPFGQEIDNTHVSIEIPQGYHATLESCMLEFDKIQTYNDDRFDAACVPVN
jgi:hypothetical protein